MGVPLKCIIGPIYKALLLMTGNMSGEACFSLCAVNVTPGFQGDWFVDDASDVKHKVQFSGVGRSGYRQIYCLPYQSMMLP